MHTNIKSGDVELLVARCQSIPQIAEVYLATDYVSCLLETVIDFQQHTTTVRRAIAHFETTCRDQIRTSQDLEELLSAFPDDKDGNTALAEHLWGYKLWTRAQMLRGLSAFFVAQDVVDLAGLRAWAERSSFKRDFEGQIRGLGPAVYNWLVMRLGVETVKPDVHILRFVESTLGRRVRDVEAVALVCQAASVMSCKTYELDWRIWEYQRAL